MKRKYVWFFAILIFNQGLAQSVSKNKHIGTSQKKTQATADKRVSDAGEVSSLYRMLNPICPPGVYIADPK
jgi:hypothetical protein